MNRKEQVWHCYDCDRTNYKLEVAFEEEKVSMLVCEECGMRHVRFKKKNKKERIVTIPDDRSFGEVVEMLR